MANSQNMIVPFDFDGVNIRTFTRDDQPWFVVSDIAQALDYRDAADATRLLDSDEKDTQNVRTLGGNQRVSVCNESGMYHLVLSSRKPEAKRFRKWVTSEVLPAIRSQGRYQADWYTKRHAIAATSKVLAGMLEEVRNAIGKVTKDHHYMNEHKLINSLLTGEYKGMDREGMSLYEMDFLAHFEIRNAILIGHGMDYPKRKELLISEAKDWKANNKPGIEPSNTNGLLPI